MSVARGVQNEKRMRHILICDKQYLSTIFKKMTLMFGKSVIEYNMSANVFTNVSETFNILREIM
jgi:hypothetical protein